MSSQHQPSITQTPLRDPKWGLCWSNRNCPDDVLVMHALDKGYIAIIWEAISSYGLEFVQTQWDRLLESSERPSDKKVQYVSDILQKFTEAMKNAKAAN